MIRITEFLDFGFWSLALLSYTSTQKMEAVFPSKPHYAQHKEGIAVALLIA
jgi:hypothetical protein